MAKEAKKEVPSLVVTSRLKEYIKEKGLRSDGELDEALSASVAALLDKAAARCKENGRSTIRPADL